MVVLIYLMVNNYYDLEKAGKRASDDVYILQFKMAIWGFLFGIIMEWKGLEKIINRKINVNWQLLVPTVLLSIFAFIPNIYWVIWFGVSEKFYLNMFLLPETHMILSVLAGVLLVRTFTES